MLKKTYCYEYQSWFCHFGAKPSIMEYGTLEEARRYQALNMRVNDDAIVGPIFVKKTVVLTDEDIKKQEQRKALREAMKSQDPVWYDAIYTHWDGTKEACRYHKDGKLIMFCDKTVQSLDLDDGENIKIFTPDHKQNTILACMGFFTERGTFERHYYVDLIPIRNNKPVFLP